MNGRVSVLRTVLIVYSLSIVATRVGAQGNDTIGRSEAAWTRVGVDAEFTYTSLTGQHPRLDGRRFVISIGHSFNDRWSMNSEVEIEHLKVERGIGGEVALEQAVLDYRGTSTLNGRVGLILLPIGRLNQDHDPNMYLSVERPLFDQIVIPTTWREIGAGLFGTITRELDYQLYISEGLLRTTFDRNGLASVKQEGSAGALTSDNLAGSDASHPAISAKLNYHLNENIQFGASAYYQRTSIDTLYPTQTDLPLTHTPSDLLVGALDARLNFAGFYFISEGAVIRLQNSGLLSTNDKPVPSQILGGYVEVAYDLFASLFFSGLKPEKSAPQLLPFIRYEFERFSYTSAQDVRYDPLTFGLAWKPLPEVIVKADYTSSPTAFTMAGMHLGFGFSF